MGMRVSLYVCKCTKSMSGAHKDQKRALGSLELVLQTLYVAMWVPVPSPDRSTSREAS